ncbi:MAG: glycosyltransferase family 2 protein [Elusimicrobiota bacterium]
MIFSIVIPAYNEEGSVQEILRRSLAAGGHLVAAGAGVTEVEVILVSDGSSDRTEELARGIAGVKVIAYPHNRGYGAAIKTGFAAARGEWLSFLDADGTCDPEFFHELLAAAREEGLDVVLGSRMHPGSKMPPVRVLGNWIFRTIVNLIGESDVTDTASGMRILRRSALDRLAPLPDGLHFTPAMSVRAILDPELKIGERPMPYEERVGRSKLSVLRDGVRFLRVILETALTYRPLKFFGWAAAALALPAVLLLLLRLGGPTEAPVPFYISRGRIEDWMFFRLILTSVLFASSVFLLSLGLVAQSLVGIINHEKAAPDGWPRAVTDRFALWGALSLAAALVINKRPLLSYWRTGEIPAEFWVFPVAGALFVLIGLQLLAFYVVAGLSRLLWERERYRRPSAGEDSQ